MSGPLVVVGRDELSQIVEQALRTVLADRTEPAEWLSTREVAALLGRHPKTLTRLAKTGAIRARKLGNAWRFRRSDVEAYLGADTP